MLKFFAYRTRAMSTIYGKSVHERTATITSLVSELGKTCRGHDSNYEDAVETLNSLMSNATAIEVARKSRATSALQVIPGMKKYLLRTGLTTEDLNKLSIIHVSGTKGKGSTCAFCERILSCHGYTTGLFTSPHLFEVRERIRINGRPLSKEKFCKYFWKVYHQLKNSEIQSDSENGDGMPFFFSFLTVLSFHVFLGEDVDVAIMEVGIGGQYDNTNVLQKPVVCGVTALGLDHTNILGKSIEEIAWNKAGIFKTGRPAIVVPQEEKAMQVILDRAKEIESPLFVSQTMDREDLNKLHVSLGIDCDKQAENACLAVQLTDFWMQLRSSDNMRGDVPSASAAIGNIPKLSINDLHETTIEGLSTCIWHGRTQTLTRDAITYYIDGAHTKESMEVCVKWFKKKADDEKLSLGGKVVRLLIFNTTGERDVEQFLTLLQDCHFDVAVFCTNQLSTVESQNKPDQSQRGISWKKMLEKATANKLLWDGIMSSGSTALSSSPSSSSSLLSTKESGHLYSSLFHRDMGNQQMQLSDINHLQPVKFVEIDNNENYISGKNIKSEYSIKRASNEDTGLVSNVQGDSEMSVEREEPHPRKRIINQEEAEVDNAKDKISLCSPELPSLALPCILHALSWATQGRDPKVKERSELNDVELPETPKVLQEAEHIQILITGSLHLVGGTLQVLTPDIND